MYGAGISSARIPKSEQPTKTQAGKCERPRQMWRQPEEHTNRLMVWYYIAFLWKFHSKCKRIRQKAIHYQMVVFESNSELCTASQLLASRSTGFSKCKQKYAQEQWERRESVKERVKSELVGERESKCKRAKRTELAAQKVKWIVVAGVVFCKWANAYFPSLLVYRRIYIYSERLLTFCSFVCRKFTSLAFLLAWLYVVVHCLCIVNMCVYFCIAIVVVIVWSGALPHRPKGQTEHSSRIIIVLHIQT